MPKKNVFLRVSHLHSGRIINGKTVQLDDDEINDLTEFLKQVGNMSYFELELDNGSVIIPQGILQESIFQFIIK